MTHIHKSKTYENISNNDNDDDHLDRAVISNNINYGRYQ